MDAFFDQSIVQLFEKPEALHYLHLFVRGWLLTECMAKSSRGLGALRRWRAVQRFLRNAKRLGTRRPLYCFNWERNCTI